MQEKLKSFHFKLELYVFQKNRNQILFYYTLVL